MRVKDKFIKNNLLLLTVGLDIIFIIIFFIFYLIGLSLEVNLTSLILTLGNQPALIFIIIHPLFMWLVIWVNTKDTRENILEIEKRNRQQDSKFDEVYEFVEKLRLGESKYVFSSEFQDDKLVRSIMNLSDELEKTRKEEELRKQEEQQRHWTNEGLAKFGAILRENVEDLEKLSSQVTSNLTKYLNAQQAGFFYIKEEEGEKVIEMLALFAFDRKKFPDKKFKWGEGLIGACAIEQKTIFLKKTSDAFVDITSGLGKANPQSILIVPIKDNEDNIHGVLEIASFKIFKDFEVNFVEQVAESIGLTMASIKTSIRTQELLRESQKQTEMLAQQETNMRQNIEEIESERVKYEQKAKDLMYFSESIENFLFHADISADGDIIFINQKLLSALKYQEEKYLQGQKFTSILASNDKIWFENIWKQLLENKNPITLSLKLISSDNNIILIDTSFVPIIDNDNNRLIHVSFIGKERTLEENKYIEQKQIQTSFEKVANNIQLDPLGNITYTNEVFSTISGYSQEELLKMSIFDIIPEKDKNNFKNIFKNIQNGKTDRAVRQIIAKDNSHLYFDIVFSPVLDINNNLKKIHVSAVDLTELYENIKINQKLRSELDKDSQTIKQINKSSQENLKNTKEKLEHQYSQTIYKNNLFEKIFDKQQKAVIIIEEEQIIYLNSIAEKLWGYKKELIIGKKIKYLLPEESYMLEIDNYLANLLSKELSNTKTCIFDKKGNKKELYADITHFDLDNKKHISILLQENSK